MAASLKQTVSLMSKVTANMPLTETSKLMDSLEKNFEDLEVKTKVMDDAMKNATSVQQPVDQVANLMQEMADEAGIEINLNIPTAPVNIGTSVALKEQVRLFSFFRLFISIIFFIFQDELTQRLAKLREN
jgi:charged multivesicular body protein 1